MKNLILSFAVITAFALLFSYCAPPEAETEECTKIENTLVSVSLFRIMGDVEPVDLKAALEKVNDVIDSIGYPHAGYKLWVVQSDTVEDFRFMLNGFWPDQEAYDVIHENELYKSAWEIDPEIWELFESKWYSRFEKVD